MEINLKYRKAFLIIAYGVLCLCVIFPFYEIRAIDKGQLTSYFVSKGLVAGFYIFMICCFYMKKLVKYWVTFFYIGCFSFTLVGEFFHPGYHYAVMQFMFVIAIIFEGFPYMATLLMLCYFVEYNLLPFSQSVFPAYRHFHVDVYIALVSTWIACVVLERYVNRVKYKKSFLDKKLRYKGIKTDLFLHDLKNDLQPLVALYPEQEQFKKIIRTIQNFNSFNDNQEILFSHVVMNTKEKLGITGTINCSGSEDFFIDQMDLQTILANLMTNSQRVALLRRVELNINIHNSFSGFSYEDNVGGMTDEQYKFFAQKDFKPYPGHEKNGLGLLLIKKLVEHQEGKFVIKKILNGTRFEVTY